MSSFTKYGETARLYTVTDSNSTKKSTFNLAGAYDTINKVVVIRSTPIEAILGGQQMVQAVANLNTTVTVREGQILYLETSARGYMIVGEPRYNRLFKRYRVELREISVSIS